MDTVYVAFKRPHVAAVKMTRGPWFLRTFAASIRHEPIAPGVTRVVYRYWLAVRPAFLKYIFEPLLDRVLLYETRRRLRALKRAMENGLPQIHSPRTIAAAECDVV